MRLELMDASTQLPLLFPFVIKLTWTVRHQGEGLVSWLPVLLAGSRDDVRIKRVKENVQFSGVQHAERNGKLILQ